MSLPRRLLLVTCLWTAAAVTAGYGWYCQLDLVRVFPVPSSFARRSGDFTANIGGTVASLPRPLASRLVKGVRYRVNGGPWRDAGRHEQRTPPPQFAIELSDQELRAGPNAVDVEVRALGRPPAVARVSFDYDPEPVRLPVSIDWDTADLEAEDGYWEAFPSASGWRVRPRPGYEGYDRMLVVAGAFSGARRVATDVVFRGSVPWARTYGFGVLPLWGGRPDSGEVRPRRGWSFGLAWYWSRYEGIGNEFSYRRGAGPVAWVNGYRDLDLEPGRCYKVVAEAWPVQDAQGRHLAYRQRLKWWSADQEEPDGWLELADAEGAPIPAGEYGVALIAYHAQADFGSVRVEPVAAGAPALAGGHAAPFP